jgi:type II pantothenate kinase
VDGPRKHERISGSTIGGGTYWGLCRLLTGSDSFKDILDLASKGDSSKVDMMVGDIYGKESKALEKIGLSSDIVASSFGKLVANQNPSKGIKEEDLARALLLMVTNNIGQVAHLNAKLHKTRKIYFIGTFLQHNVISQQRLAYSIDYWSQGTMEAQFLEHEVNCYIACVALLFSRILCSFSCSIGFRMGMNPHLGIFWGIGSILVESGHRARWQTAR